MSLEKEIMFAMKNAMKAKDQSALRALRAIKSALIIHKTNKGSSENISSEDEMKLLPKISKAKKG